MDGLATAAPAVERAAPKGSPSTVYGRLVDLQGRDLTVLTATYDGTAAGAREATRRLQHQADREGWPWSMSGTSWIATDDAGRAAWAISPNLQHVAAAGTDDAAYLLGDVSRRPGGPSRRPNPPFRCWKSRSWKRLCRARWACPFFRNR